MALASIYLPNSLNIFLSHDCNLRCSYCFLSKDYFTDRLGRNKIGLENLKKSILNFIKQYPGYKKVCFTGGEPLLRFQEIRELVSFIGDNRLKKRDLNISIVTNGTLLNNNVLRFLKDEDIGLRISLDGGQKDNDFNRRFRESINRSTYAQIKKNLEKTFKFGLMPKANLVFTPQTLKNLPNNILKLRKSGFFFIDFFPSLFSIWSKKDLKEIENVFNKIANLYLSCDINNPLFFNSLLHKIIINKHLPGRYFCNKTHLDSSGKYYYCDKAFALPENKRSEYLVGNDASGIDNARRVDKIRQILSLIDSSTNNKCLDCRFLKYCFCPVGLYIYCSAFKLNFSEYFRNFCQISKVYNKTFLKIKKYLE